MNQILGYGVVGSILYIGWSKLCENAHVQEPIAYVFAKVADKACEAGKSLGKMAGDCCSKAAAKWKENQDNARKDDNAGDDSAPQPNN